MQYLITEAQISQLETVRAHLEIFSKLAEHITQKNIVFSTNAFLETMSHLQEQMQYALDEVVTRKN